ncbi:SGNH/GDSL hydrolase family protein [Agrobacterium tumefaciens]|uniref:SGNH/GDSL hydrolase family protein n=1 Tax=Agrobacterium tumefaciens TaxID=358 RepID=UPI0015725D68|nr:SGNH/GDSL hydrolase family protein [Agrobacterium tumefaciens]NTD85513.1 SGNH/GDSL hydrolase family protein [Agrobacterium tumefaciens]NTD90862.1 SGNH/GDSL hydrolase family protein [Agrobacterium tumefaciens]NTE03684.1 SGNH/GDSL hydrolase family protein [Agrobacterium tumefaciens]NTE15936.1 SGNH/GDSL hydrolase family protein [Agrobacterium tumefaciens]NTE26510.1 SGNH/GDSL hydrolase family protein [Agrobacterium tumefaciens]
MKLRSSLGPLKSIGPLSSLAGKAGGPRRVENAFSPLVQKLEGGQNVNIFANTDSTGHSEYGPYYKFAVALGELYNATVIMHRWAEWGGSSANGPKDYAAPVVLRSGSSQTIDIWLASLPGQVAGCMFESSRKPTAIDAIPKPDVAITHHGHNMQSFETPGNDLAIGRGLFWSVIGMISWQWQGVPQVLTTQNPWRDDTSYSKVYNAIMGVAGAFPSLTLVDSYQRFLDASKNASFYRDNIHPSDTAGNSSGAQLVADALMATYKRAKKGAFSTVSWMELPIGSNLFVNGDLLNWPSTVPVNFTNVAGNTVLKDTDPANIFAGSGAAYSAQCKPAAANGHFSSLSNGFDATERASMAGKTVTAIMLVKGNPLQKTPFTAFATQANGGFRSYSGGALLWDQQSGKNVGGWMPIVYGAVPCDPVNNDANSKFSFSPAFGAAAPPTTDVAWLQRCVIIEGLVPRLGLVRP